MPAWHPPTPPTPLMNQRGGRAGDREKESTSDDLFICVFLEEQNGLFWFWLPGRKAGRAREAASPSPRPRQGATSCHVGRGPWRSGDACRMPSRGRWLRLGAPGLPWGCPPGARGGAGRQDRFGSQLCLGTEVAWGRVLCSERVFLHQAGGLQEREPGRGTLGRHRGPLRPPRMEWMNSGSPLGRT